jgi:hypothetical protein
MEPDKTMQVNYRKALNQTMACDTCTVKLGCPYWWCDRIGQPAKPGMTCDCWDGRERKEQE